MFSLSFVFPCFVCFSRRLHGRKLNSGVSVNRARTIPLSCVCVCSVFRVLSYSPLFLLSQYFLPSLCNLSFVSEGGSMWSCSNLCYPPPTHTHTHKHPLPSFSHAFHFFYPLPLFLTSFLFFSTDSSISGSGL